MEPEKILIIKPSSLGDIVHTLPAVAAIRAARPEAEITWVINPEWAPILRGNRDINHVHVFPRKDFRGFGAPRHFLPWLRDTRRLKADVAIDFQGLFRSAFIAKGSGAKKIYGLSDGREGSRLFYDVKAKVSSTEHAVDRYLKLAAAFGAPALSPLRFPLPSGDSLPRFGTFPKFVVLHPYARGSKKSLSGRAIIDFCKQMDPMIVVVVGKSKSQISPPLNCANLTNQTSLMQLVWLLRHAAFVVSVDSGPMHIAAAVTDHLFSIHTWSDPGRVGPYNPKAFVWRAGKIEKVQDLDPAAPLAKARRFRRTDIPALVEVVQQAL